MSLVLSHRIEDLAATLGRLRNRLDPETLNGMIAEDAANGVDLLDAMTFPTAAELFAQFHDTEDEDDAVDHALSVMDARRDRIHRLLRLGGEA